MDNRHENKLGTYYRVDLLLFYKLLEIATQIPAFNAQALLYRDNLGLLDTYAIGADRNNLGAAMQKKLSRISLGETVVSISGGFYSHYKSINDLIMAEQGSINASEFYEFTDAEVFLKSTELKDLCSPFEEAMENWNVHAGDIGVLAAKIEVYKSYLEEPRLQQQLSAGFRVLMLKQFDIIDEILDLLDHAIETIKQSHPELYLAWKNARRTYDDASGHSTITPTASPTILPHCFYVVGNYPFLAKRVIKVSNHGPKEVGFGLTDNEAGYSNYERILQAGKTSNVQSSTLGASGDILLLHNNTDEPITVDVWVFE